MADIPEIGKISHDIFQEIIFPRLGAVDASVLVGPAHGTDVGIAEIGGKAVSFTTDPVFIVPEYGWERAAWFAVHILASDSVTSGLAPKYLSIDLNLPMDISKAAFKTVWDTVHRTCLDLGVTVITGHTGRYEGCQYPMVGGGTMIGVGELDKYVSPRFIREGDHIIITKGPAIEACGILATMFPQVIEQEFGQPFAARAEKLFYQMSVVKEAFLAVKCGVRDQGVSAMHDATECGIWGGLYEMAEAAGLGVSVDQSKIVVEDGVFEICRLFGIDPYASISEGTLIIACRPQFSERIANTITAAGIKASKVGTFTSSREGMTLLKNGIEFPLRHPIVDPFWKAFFEASAKYQDAGSI